MTVGTRLQTPIHMGPQTESYCNQCDLVDSCLQRGHHHNKHLRRMEGRFDYLEWRNMMGVSEQYWTIQYWAIDGKNCRILGPAGTVKSHSQTASSEMDPDFDCHKHNCCPTSWVSRFKKGE